MKGPARHDADGPSEAEIARALEALARQRGAGRTFCPSEAARALAPEDWRGLMPRVRRVAAALQRAGRLQAMLKGRPVAPEAARGPIRLGLPRG
ncbi:MAG: DUF3253 domain-containing protein [Paracoccaceae bacterium]|jgi:hypothetical protein|nr:DUF3253 domain-containing protein [Paracoccaceae bacterium]